MNLYNMTNQQQVLFNLLQDELVNTDPEDLARHIRGMGIGALRQNITVFEDTGAFIRDCDARQSRDMKKQSRDDVLCRSNFRPCIRRRGSTDNTCEHYPYDNGAEDGPRPSHPGEES